MRKSTLLIVLLFSAVGIEAAPVKLGKRHKDESNGFQMRIPSKWEQVPTKFQDIVVVGKFVAKRRRRGHFAPEVHILRFAKPKGAPEGTSPADVVKRGIPGRAGMIRFQPKDVWAFTQRTLGSNAELIDEDHDFKMSRSKTQVAHYRVYKGKPRVRGRDADKATILAVAASIELRDRPDFTYGVVFYATMADQKDVMRPFRTMIRRFRILSDDDEDEEGDTTDADIFVSSESKPDVWRAARKKKLGSLKNWAALDTPNYLIVYNKAVKKRLLKKIAKHIEAIRTQVYEKLFPPAHEIKAVSVVRVCKDLAEYHKYGGPSGSAGYWSRGDEELVVPAGMPDSLRVLYHEAFHQYIHYAIGDVSPHSWFNEGHGDYFAGHNYRGRKFKPAAFKWRVGTISAAISSKTFVPLKRFLKYTQGEYYANAGLCYAQGWSLVYFLREVERKKIRKYKQYWGLLDRYFEAIKANVKSVKESAFEGLDPKPEPKPGDALDAQPEPEEPELPRLPGLAKPFPDEHPDAGAKDPDAGRGTGETRSVAQPKITGVKSALDAAVDKVFFGKIDIEQLQKDWIEWSK